MSRPAPVIAGAESFHHDGDDLGVVVCHGFTSTPQSMMPLAKGLAEAGHTVTLPRLPGHGTTWQDCNRTTWHDWYAAVEAALLEMAPNVETVVVAGLSMGGALAARLTQQHPTIVDALVLVNPCFRVDDPRMRALPALQRVVPSLAGIGDDRKMSGGEAEVCYDRTPLRALYSQTKLWSQVVTDLPQIDVPVLLIRSSVDNVVPKSSGDLFLRKVGSRDVTEVTLLDSYHVAFLDNDGPYAVERVLSFVERVAARRSRP